MSEDFLSRLGVGSRVATYQIESQLGAGGMAVVFMARDERLGRQVALKVFVPSASADRAARQRFVQEWRTHAAVDDPRIIPVYDAGEADGVLYIAMRLVRGGDLRQLLAREGVLRPARAAGIISQVASALDAAHGAGLVHRDIKPANILLDARPDGSEHVYLSDFGISKRALMTVTLTEAGTMLGTPAYAAPEQFQGRPVDGRTDQYALACVAYELLTGAPPFEREEAWALPNAHLSDPPPSARARRPELPAGVDAVLARALAKVPEKRYGSCWEFADALRKALGLAADPAYGPAEPPPEAVGTEWTHTAMPAGRMREVTQPSAPAGAGSSLLQPPSQLPGRAGAPPRRRYRGRNARWLGWAVLGVAVVLGAGLVIYGLVTHGSPATSAAGDVSRALGPKVNPAQQPRGSSREIFRVVAAGNTVATTGSQTSGGVASQQFFVSDDGGATWHLASTKLAGAGKIPAGHTADRIASGGNGWVATGPQAIWTSSDGLSWTLAATHGISPQRPGDDPEVITGTADGFLAAGQTRQGHGVFWTSRNGTTWQQFTAMPMGLTVGGQAAGNIQYATSHGNDTLISDGSSVWLSTDGGASWAPVTVPLGHGASGGIKGLSFDSSGLIAVRPGTTAGGAQDGVAYFSRNGRVWQFAGLIDPGGGWTPGTVKGSAYGFVVLAGTGSQQDVAYLSTGTGTTWRPTGSLGDASDIQSATVGSDGTVIAVGAADQHVVFLTRDAQG